MKTFVNSILITGILSIVTTASMVAQTGNSGFEQWYRAKYGRPSPALQASPKATEATATAPEATQSTIAVTRFEQWYRAKYGRPSPTEQAIVKAPQEAPAEAALPMVAMIEFDRSANTPAEHQRIAQNYRNQAEDYLAQAKEHQAMVAAYKATPNINAKNQAATIGHCEYFAAKFNELAGKSQELANLHEQMGRDAAKK